MVRLEGYDDLETGRKLAQADLSQITNLGLATQMDLYAVPGQKCPVCDEPVQQNERHCPKCGESRERDLGKLRWVDDHILCFIGKFDLDGVTYVIDILWDGEDAYADFKYAADSKEAREGAISSIENWIGCATDTGGFYDPATGIISDVRGIVHLNENGEPNKVPGFGDG